MKKRVTVFLLVGMLIVFCCACNGGKETTESTSAIPEDLTETTEQEEEKEDVKEVEESPIFVYEEIYFVGPTEEYQSLTKLFLDLKDNKNRKKIVVREGVYDIYQEYRDAGIPTPPDDVASPDYMDKVVFLPENTILEGEGNVILEWNPPKEAITLGEARTFSPLNVTHTCHIENIEIHCKYGRYCIHDDSHNALSTRATIHLYRNVRCVYEYSEDGKGFNNVIGFGFSENSRYIFEDCSFEMKNCPEGDCDYASFYGHTPTAVDGENGATIIIRRSKINSGENAKRACRLQNLNTKNHRATVRIEDTEIVGGIRLESASAEVLQSFDLTLKNSGKPQITIDFPEKNSYPVKQE